MSEKQLNWQSEMPNEEGEYLVDDGKGERKVRIENMKIDNNPERPDNFHVIEDDCYYALSVENGCANWSWAKLQ